MGKRVTIVAHRRGSTNEQLVRAWKTIGVEVRILVPERALAEVEAGEVVVNRLDVLETLDGVEPGLEHIDALARLGARVVNSAEALRATHDKLETAARLGAARLPHPRTTVVLRPDADVEIAVPVVVKPRHGSWGRDVFRCTSQSELRSCLAALHDRTWFRTHGALIQELVPPCGHDLRLIVAAGTVTGAAERVAAAGEWRTNISLGGRLRPAAPDGGARAVAVAAAAALGADFVGVDLMPTDAGWVIVELNGAVDFDDRYWIEGTNVYAATAEALALATPAGAPPAGRA